MSLNVLKWLCSDLTQRNWRGPFPLLIMLVFWCRFSCESGDCSGNSLCFLEAFRVYPLFHNGRYRFPLRPIQSTLHSVLGISWPQLGGGPERVSPEHLVGTGAPPPLGTFSLCELWGLAEAEGGCAPQGGQEPVWPLCTPWHLEQGGPGTRGGQRATERSWFSSPVFPRMQFRLLGLESHPYLRMEPSCWPQMTFNFLREQPLPLPEGKLFLWLAVCV